MMSSSKNERLREDVLLPRSANGRLKVVLLTNVLAAARLPIYEQLAETFDLHVLYSSNSASSDAQVDGRSSGQNFVTCRVPGFSLQLPRHSSRDEVFDWRRIQITPRLFLELLRRRPDAVISTELGFRTSTALAYGALFNRPVWVWSGGTLHSERALGLDQKIIRRTLVPRIRHWISYGTAATEYLESIGATRDAIVQIQNCVDHRLFQSSPAPAFSLTPRPVMLVAGQLIGRKGVKQYLESAARLQAQGHVFSSLVAGDGPDALRLQETSEGLGVRNLKFIPAQPAERMPAVYRSADALVFPTLEDVWGLVVNEAIYAGVPVLSSVHAGVTRDLVPESNWFDPGDAVDFDRALSLAITGRLAPSDTSRLRVPAEVAQMIEASITRTCRAVLPLSPRPVGGVSERAPEGGKVRPSSVNG